MASKKQHSPIGASNSHRWMECPGSVALEANFPNISSPYALEGSAAHRLGEKALLSNQEPSSFVGKIMLMEDGSVPVVTEEMAEAVTVYTNYVNARALEYGVKPELEMKLHLSWINAKLYGTADCVIADPVLGRMLVIDYKHGQGVTVSPEENSQAMFYALGAIGDGEGPDTYHEVELVIVQPRAMGQAIKSWKTTGRALADWGIKVLAPAAKRALGKNQPLNAGEHCKFCRAAGSCPEQMRSALKVAGETFKPVDIAKGELPNSLLIPVEELGRILSLVPRFENWVADIRNRVEQELNGGKKVPGWKMVQGRSNRKWIDEAKTVEAISPFIPIADHYEAPKLKSPAQIEATAKKLKITLDISQLVCNPPGKPSLAPDTDTRPALTGATPSDVFTKQEINE